MKLPRKWVVFEKRILSPEETARVLALLEEPNLPICDTFLDTGTRISEVTGLMIKHVDFEKGILRIDQRNCRGGIDVRKTAKSRRALTMGGLASRYAKWIASLQRKGPNDWVFPKDEDLSLPRWDSGVRKALKEAARAIKPEGADADTLASTSLVSGRTRSGAPTSRGERRSAETASRPARSRGTRAPP